MNSPGTRGAWTRDHRIRRLGARSGSRAGYRLERLVAVRQTSGESVASATGDYALGRARWFRPVAGVAAQHTLGELVSARTARSASCR